MPKIRTRVTFNQASTVARIKAANNRALTTMGNQALKDANMFVPHDQGFLENSSLLSSDREAKNGSFWLRWTEPYSRYLWFGLVMHGTPGNRTYGPDELNYTKALAYREWAKHAREVYGNDWKKVYQATLRKEIRDG